jgi:hypothetical protein
MGGTAMKLDNDELLIRDALNSIHTPEHTVYADIHSRIRPRPRLKKTVVTAFVIGLSLIFTAAVLAAVTSFGRLLPLIGQESADMLTPVQLSCEKEGVKVEVVAAARYENVLRAYITIQDLEKKGRITENVSFLDYYSFTSSGGVKPLGSSGETTSYSCVMSRVHYDKDSQTATLLFETQAPSGFAGENLTLSLQKLFYSEKKYNEPVALDEFKNIEDTLQVPFSSYDPDKEVYMISGGGWDRVLEGVFSIGKPKAFNQPVPNSRFTTISNVGIIEGRLHIQTFRDERVRDGETTPRLYFKDSQGKEIGESISFNMFSDEAGNLINLNQNHGPYYYRISEYIFEEDPQALSQCQLFADLTAWDILEGNWKVTFPAEAYDGITIQKECHVSIGDSVVTSVTMNPLCLVIRRQVPGAYSGDSPKVQIDMGAETIELSPPSSGFGEGEIWLDTYMLDVPVSIESVKAIVIDGVRIEL